jgi:hypothetical protein
VLVAVVLSVCVLPVTSASAPATGGTTVTVGNQTVDIHVTIDVLVDGLPSFVSRSREQIAADAQAAAKLWNEAFARYRYPGCLTLHLDLTLNLLYGATEGSDYQLANGGGLTYPVTAPGHHVVQWTVGSDDRPVQYDPWGTKGQTGDFTDPYSHDLPAFWSDVLSNANAVAHELGHYLGLGDDYVDPTDGGASVPLPGRENTLMADGYTGAIDQNLVDRLVNLLRKAGYDVPKCKVWEGPIHLDAGFTSPSSEDHGTGDGTVTLVQDANGALAGTVSVHTTSGCNKAPAKTSYDLQVSGQASRRKLVINSLPSEVVSDSWGEGICGFPDGFLGDPPSEKGSPITPFVVHIKSPTIADGSGTIVDRESQGINLHSAYSIKLELHER